jgi:Holliday junction DNA helicase RuvA
MIRVRQRTIGTLHDIAAIAASDAAGISAAVEEKYRLLPAVEPQSDNAEEAVKALLVLGYSRGQAKSAVAQTDASAPVEEIVRAALRLLMK